MKAICPQCGYDLTGIRTREYQARCPECGRPFWPDRPQELLAPWPSVVVILTRMCLPSWIVFAMIPLIGWGLPRLLRTGTAGGDAFVVAVAILVAIATGAIVLPSIIAHRLVRQHALPPQKPIERTAGLVMASLLVHIVVGIMAYGLYQLLW